MTKELLKISRNSKDVHAKQIRQLEKMWKRAHTSDLRVRLETGQLLNEWFGAPDQRQNYGARVLRRYSAAIGLDVSDLSRMRCFAQHFGSIEDLKAKHPEVRTWTAVRRLLVELNAPLTGRVQREPTAGRSGGSNSTPGISSVVRRLEAVKTAVERVGSTLSAEERTALREAALGILNAVDRQGGVTWDPSSPSLQLLANGIHPVEVAYASGTPQVLSAENAGWSTIAG